MDVTITIPMKLLEQMHFAALVAEAGALGEACREIIDAIGIDSAYFTSKIAAEGGGVDVVCPDDRVGRTYRRA